MDWVKLSTNYYLDPKIVGLDADAEVLFIRGLAYAGDQETRGFIPERIVPSLARSRRPAATVRKLVDADLWKHAPGGYRMPAWGHWQDQLDVLAARRAADRDRKRRERAGKPPPTSNVRGQSRDVRVLEGEEELELRKGGMSTHDPRGAGPPPRRCQQHQDTAQPPPCGACRDARIAYDAWQRAHANGNASPPALPPVDDVIDRDVDPDPERNVEAIHRIRQQHPLATRQP